MYQALKNNTVQYILDYEPTPEQLEALGCDSYAPYEDPAETPEQQKARVKQSLISSNDLSTVDLEGVTFTDKEIGDIILERVFGWNPHAESALQAKTSAYLLSALSWDPNTQLLEEITTKRSQVNEIRNKFNLNTL